MSNKAKLKWEPEFDADYKHYRAQIVPGNYCPYFWLCDMTGYGRDYGVSIVYEDDDEVLVDGEKAVVPLDEAKAVAARHLLTLPSRGRS
jgi:hypothetical protein